MVEVLDNACWHTSHHAVARNVFQQHGSGYDEHIVAHCDAANHFSTAAHLHVVAYYGSLQIMVKPYSDLLVYLAVFANPLGRDDCGKTMLYYQASANVVGSNLKGILPSQPPARQQL